MLISTQNLSVHMGKRQVLDNINMSVDSGEILTVIGPNGSGKSTLLRALIGAVPASSGQVVRDHELKVGYVPQTLHIDETLPMTVGRFMRLPRSFSKAEITQALEHAGAPGLEGQQVMALSGGQFQRVLLARALLGEPELLLLDEATQGLDHKGSIGFYRQIENVRRELNCAVIMVSHELHVVMRKTDRVICLNGHICCEGKPEVVSSSPEYHSLFGIESEGETALYVHKEHNHCDHEHSGGSHA